MISLAPPGQRPIPATCSRWDDCPRPRLLEPLGVSELEERVYRALLGEPETTRGRARPRARRRAPASARPSAASRSSARRPPGGPAPALRAPSPMLPSSRSSNPASRSSSRRASRRCGAGRGVPRRPPRRPRRARRDPDRRGMRRRAGSRSSRKCPRGALAVRPAAVRRPAGQPSAVEWSSRRGVRWRTVYAP